MRQLTLEGCPASQDAWDFVRDAAARGELPSVPHRVDHDAPFVHCTWLDDPCQADEPRAIRVER